MTLIQEQKLAAFNRTEALNQHQVYASKMATLDEFDYEHTRLTNSLLIIKAAAEVQSGTQDSVDTTVNPIKLILAKKVYKFTRRAYRLAKQLGLTDLAKSLNYPITYISSAPKDKTVDRVNALKKVLEDNKVTPLTNIKAADILEIKTAADAYIAVKDLPIESIQAKKVEGTDTLIEAFDIGVDAMNAICDYAESYFSESDIIADKQMVAAYALARHYIIVGHRSTGILGNVSKATVPCYEAIIKILDTDKFAITDYLGNYSLAHVEAGFYTVTCTTKAGETVTKTVYIHNGVMEELDFVIA